jgi:hypothetical protein
MTTATSETKPSVGIASPMSTQQVTVETLEDILYEIVATGLEPSEPGLNTRDIEEFLHEHARAAKPKEDFLKFFKDHKLSTDPNVHLKSVGLALLPTKIETPANATSQSPISKSVETNKSNATDEPVSSPRLMLVGDSEESSEVRIRREQQHHSDTPLLGWLAILLIAALFGLTIGLGYLLFEEVRRNIDQTKALQMENLRLVEAIKSQVTTLQIDVASNREDIQKLQAKTDLVLDSLIPVEEEKEK